MNRKEELEIIIGKLINKINNQTFKFQEVMNDWHSYLRFLKDVELLEKYKKEYKSL